VGALVEAMIEAMTVEATSSLVAIYLPSALALTHYVSTDPSAKVKTKETMETGTLSASCLTMKIGR